MRRETTLNTLEWSRERNDGKQTECSDRGIQKGPTMASLPQVVTFHKTWLDMAGWMVFVYVNKWPSQLWVAWDFLGTCSLKPAGSNLTTHILQPYIANNDNHIWGCLAQYEQNGSWFPPCSNGESLSNAADCVELYHLLVWPSRWVGSRSSTRMAIKKTSHDHRSHRKNIGKRGQFPNYANHWKEGMAEDAPSWTMSRTRSCVPVGACWTGKLSTTYPYNKT